MKRFLCCLLSGALLLSVAPFSVYAEESVSGNTVPHEHSLEYWSNASGPGHWEMCSDYEGCGYCELKDCTFENGVCIYCGREEEEIVPYDDMTILEGSVLVFDEETVYVE